MFRDVKGISRESFRIFGWGLGCVWIDNAVNPCDRPTAQR